MNFLFLPIKATHNASYAYIKIFVKSLVTAHLCVSKIVELTMPKFTSHFFVYCY